VDSAAAPRDLHVVESRGAQLLFVGPGPAEDRVRMRVDESGHEHAAAAIDARAVRITRLEVVAGSDRDDSAIGDRDGGVREDPGVAHLGAAAGAPWARARDNLRCIYEKKLRRQKSEVRGE
jgi:hypothetical protein